MIPRTLFSLLLTRYVPLPMRNSVPIAAFNGLSRELLLSLPTAIDASNYFWIFQSKSRRSHGLIPASIPPPPPIAVNNPGTDFDKSIIRHNSHHEVFKSERQWNTWHLGFTDQTMDSNFSCLLISREVQQRFIMSLFHDHFLHTDMGRRIFRRNANTARFSG